jgi:hypothetical protein
LRTTSVGRTIGGAAETVNDVVLAGFRGSVQTLEGELNVMPLSRWNESVLRYYFCRSVATAFPGVEQLVECGKIDLVLTRAPARAFIEFKFYSHPVRFDPYGGGERGFKGRPSLKNLREFQACIDQLHARAAIPGLSKYVVLVYADPADDSQPGPRYSKHYEEYRHAREGVMIRLIEATEPISTDEGTVRAKLFEVGAAQQ